MDKAEFKKEFKDLKVTEQAAFVVLGVIDSTVHTLTNIMNSVAGLSGDLASFVGEDGTKKYLDRAKGTD